MSEEFSCNICDVEPDYEACEGCEYKNLKWWFRFLQEKWHLLWDKILRRNCSTCAIPTDNFCETLHLGFLNQEASTNEIRSDIVCDQYKRKKQKK